MKRIMLGMMLAGLVLGAAVVGADEGGNGGTILLKDGDKMVKIQAGAQGGDLIEQLLWRVDHLERIVEQLQRQCASRGDEFPKQAQGRDRDAQKNIWTCTVNAMGEVYYGNGATKGLAEKRAVQECKEKGADPFFCRVTNCSKE